MTLNKKVVSIREAKLLRDKKSLIAELKVYRDRKTGQHSYKLNKGKFLSVSDDTILHCFSQVFGDMLSFNDNPETVYEAIEGLVERFTDEKGEYYD